MFGTDNQPYQPTQLYHLAQDGFSCELLPADKALQSVIYYYWKLTIKAASVSLPVIPDGALDLVLSPQIADFAALYSPKSQPFNIPLQGPIVYVGACFHAEKARSLFSRTPAELDELEAGSYIVKTLSLGGLVQAVQGELDSAKLVAAFNHFFTHYQPGTASTSPSPLLAELFDLLEVGAVRTMAKQVGLSERQFRRVTNDLFGLSPKQIHRILRLQEALGELLHPDKPLPLTDYYDDSHKIRELKALTGLTPGDIRRMAEKYNKAIKR